MQRSISNAEDEKQRNPLAKQYQNKKAEFETMYPDLEIVGMSWDYEPSTFMARAEGGELSRISDVNIRVPATETYMIQELHLPVYHCLCLMLEERFFGS